MYGLGEWWWWYGFLFKSTFLFSSRKFKYDWFAPVDEREIVHDTISTWYRASSNGTLAIARLGHSKKCSLLILSYVLTTISDGSGIYTRICCAISRNF